MADQRAEDGTEVPLGGGHHLGHGQRGGDRPVLRYQLTDHHQEDGGEGGTDHQAHRRGRTGREAHRLDGPAQQLPDRGLGEHADDQVGDGDTELGARQLEGEAAYRPQRARRAALPRSAAASSSLRSTVVSENSAATKAEQASESSSATMSRSTSVIGSPLSHDRPGSGGTRDVGYWDVGYWGARPWADAHTFRSVVRRTTSVKERQRAGRSESGRPLPPLLAPVPGPADRNRPAVLSVATAA